MPIALTHTRSITIAFPELRACSGNDSRSDEASSSFSQRLLTGRSTSPFRLVNYGPSLHTMRDGVYLSAAWLYTQCGMVSCCSRLSFTPLPFRIEMGRSWFESKFQGVSRAMLVFRLTAGMRANWSAFRQRERSTST